jgi:predicted kinase
MNLPRKLLIQMSGAPGAGKSTVAKLLGQSIDGVVIDYDLTKSFFLENGIDFNQSGKLAYRFNWVLAEEMIKQGRSVIIDSPCNFSEILDTGTALAGQYDYGYKYLECRVEDVDLLDRRLRNRVQHRSQRTGVNRPPADASIVHRSEEEHRALFKRWIENPCRPASDTVVVDSTLSPEECRDYVLKQIVPPTGSDTGDRATAKSALANTDSLDY